MTVTPDDTGSSPSPAEQRPALGWWWRFGHWLADWSRPAERPELPLQIQPGSGSRFATPASGDAYDFLVSIHWRWTDGRWSTRQRGRPTGPGRSAVGEDISRTVRCVLRGFPPNQPAEAEAAVNRNLRDMANKDGRWDARAEVGLDETVREHQQESWKRVLTQQADQKLVSQQQRADRALADSLLDDYTALAARWRVLLADVGLGTTDDVPAPFLGRYLVRLAADPTTAADVVDQMAARREELDRQLMDKVADAIKGRDQVNLLEADLAYDSALRRLMDWAGLQLLEPLEQPLPGGAP